ncbi:head-tail connector protein [Rummeliibacillus stabekisii]|uniref:head-tail connector protein n=1 Tax=Rummeliibacillus stabekisii TaxID=241244 RepID=UPI00371AAE76
MDLIQLKEYLRIDHNFDDMILKSLQQVAEQYVINAVDSENSSYISDKRFEFVVTLLVGHWYESRIATSDNALNEIPYGVLPLIQQLRGVNNA